MFPQKKKQPMMGEDEQGGLPAPKPFERKDEPEEAEQMAQHEATETPEQEGMEQGGSDLYSDLEAVGQRYGADAATSRSLAADMFDAFAKCLRGGKQQPETFDVGDDGDASVDTYE